MSAFLSILVWLVALFAGSVVVRATRLDERRWAAVGALLVALLGALGLGVVNGWGTHPVMLGPFVGDAVPTTMAPAMLVGALALTLLAGRAEASGHELSWLLATLGLESVALLAGDLWLLLVAEAAATALLAQHARRRGHRAHVAYLTLAAVIQVVAAVLAFRPETLGIAGVLMVVGALIRLGVFPFSTGMLASLQHGPTTATLMASLPFGGVLLLIRASSALAEVPVAQQVVITLLLISAPLAAALSITQRSLGRSLGYMLAATHALIALGALEVSASAQLGGELLWAGALLTATGFGAACNLVFLRMGDPDLHRHHGLHINAPFLSLSFLVLGMGLAGAPGTVEFIAEDVLLNTASSKGLVGMALVVGAIALIGFNVLRLQFRLFFGASMRPRSYLRTKSRERLGLILVGSAVVLGGVAPGLIPLITAAATGGH